MNYLLKKYLDLERRSEQKKESLRIDLTLINLMLKMNILCVTLNVAFSALDIHFTLFYVNSLNMEDVNVLKHKEIFEEYLRNVKTNSKLITRADLDKIRLYLENLECGMHTQLEYNLKRRVASNKFFLLSLTGDSSETRTICVASKKVNIILLSF